MKTLTNIGEIKMFFVNQSTASVKTFIEILDCVLTLQTVNLYKCKDKMSRVSGNKKVKAGSHYKKLLRWFCMNDTGAFCEGIFMFIISLLTLNSTLLVMDRTNWKTGKKNINLLTLGILFNNCFIPLCWVQLNKRGNSNFLERNKLMEKFIRLWSAIGNNIQQMGFVADREFIGPDWVHYLHNTGILYSIRVKGNMYFTPKGRKKNDSCVTMLKK